ncbi:UNVERIFIED_CONTAM: hypothetical protein PYX00_004350 [Menopon gallinae]
MGVQNLQNFLEAGHVEGGAVPVELLKIARSFQRPVNQNRSNPNNKKLSLILDAECCLSRLYGGYFSDWTCGGQWNRMFQYLSHLIMTCQNGNIELTVAFNGALEPQRFHEWAKKQLKNKSKANLVLQHLQNKGTPPPKVWWIAPVCLITSLRMALRYYNVPVIFSMDDHHQEVIAYCRENNLHGVIGDDPEYIVFNPPRYFSAANLKLTYWGLIETKEFLISHLAKGLGLSTEKLCILAALLGNHLLLEKELASFHTSIDVCPSKNPLEATVRGVAAYVKTLENTDNLEALAVHIFGNGVDQAQKREAFVESVQYYLSGTKEGFLKYKPRKGRKSKILGQRENDKKKKTGTNNSESDKNESDKNESVDNSRFASETVESEAGSIAAYKIATAAVAQPAKFTQQLEGDEAEETKAEIEKDKAIANGDEEILQNGNIANNSSVSLKPGKPDSPRGSSPNLVKQPKIPSIPPDVLRTACERHQKGLMSPYIYQILTQGEIKLPVLIEEEISRDWQSIHSVYKPIRKNVYAILFNLHHQMYIANKENYETNEEGTNNTPEILVREWVCTAMNQYTEPEIVKAEPVGWPVPTIQRLWFGFSVGDMRRRLRAYLTCMKSDSQLMVCSAYVPQHLLVMATVLRYLMQVKPPILRKAELDSFIVTAFSPDLMNAEMTQELQLEVVSSRAVQLGTLFMQGVETALLANDACGAPIPWLMCCPWLYFDGKLFHSILSKTERVKTIWELCNHRQDIISKVERMKNAIVENLTVQYARRPMHAMPGIPYPPVTSIPSAGYNPALDMIRRNNPRGLPRRPIPSRGGQLEIGGVVVGNWGPNPSLNRARLATPQIAEVGGVRNFNRNNFHTERPGFPAYKGFNKRRPGTGAKKNKTKKADKKKEPRGRGITDANTNIEKVG